MAETNKRVLLLGVTGGVGEKTGEALSAADPDPNAYLDLGIRHVVAVTQGPEWKLDGLRDLLVWRRSVA